MVRAHIGLCAASTDLYNSIYYYIGQWLRADGPTKCAAGFIGSCDLVLAVEFTGDLGCFMPV